MTLELIITAVLLVAALTVISTAYASPDKQYNAALAKSQLAANECAATFLQHETNHKWLLVMRAAFLLDQQDAERQIALAAAAYEKGELKQALAHLQAATNWYKAYNARLKRVYGIEPGEIPPIPVIK